MHLPFDPAELAMLESTGFFGVPDEKLEEIAETMYAGGLSLTQAAWECGIDPANLSAEDKAAIREYYDAM